VRLDEHLPPDQKRAQDAGDSGSFPSKIAAVLTPGALEKWKKMQAPSQPQPRRPDKARPAKQQ